MSTAKTKKANLGQLLSGTDQFLISVTMKGIRPKVLTQLSSKLGLTAFEVGAFMGLSRASVSRKLRSSSMLGLIESDRVIRYSQLWRKAVHLWRSEQAAREWLNNPEPSFLNETPLQHAVTEVGSRQVEDLMGQLAYGNAT